MLIKNKIEQIIYDIEQIADSVSEISTSSEKDYKELKNFLDISTNYLRSCLDRLS